MTDPNTPSAVAAGWYPETAGSSRLRWWDGTAWTDHTADPTTPAQPAEAQPAAAQAAPAQPAATQAYAAPGYGAQPYTAEPPRSSPGVNTGTVFIYLIALLPLLSLVPYFFVNLRGDFSGILADPQNSSAALSLYLDPAYDAALVLPFVLFVLTILFAWRDRVTLLARGIDRPFAWPWIFLNYIIYIIGRSVVVRRRTARGLGPLWVWIGTIVVNVGIVVALFAKVAADLGPLASQFGVNS